MTCVDADDVSAFAECDALDPGVLLKCPVFLLVDRFARAPRKQLPC
jgi:hypothetical protein